MAHFKLVRAVVPAGDIEDSARFYAELLQQPGERVSPGRHYFDLGAVVLVCLDPKADGDDFEIRANPDHLYIATDDLEGVFKRAIEAGCQKLEEQISTRAWGERSFYCCDPFGNPLCFIDRGTVVKGMKK